MDMSINMRPLPPPPRIVVMGVSGSGKTTIGRMLAIRLGLRFVEGDELKAARNRAAGAPGLPLDDEQRSVWLDAVAAELSAAAPYGAVVSCGALKRRDRDRLRRAAPELRLVHLHGDGACLAERQRRRGAQGLPVAPLPLQLEALELPLADEHALVADIARAPELIVGELLRRMEIFQS